MEGGGWTEVPAMDDRTVAKNHCGLQLAFILACIENRNANVGALVKLTMPR